ncbi:hypothetical protein E2C01_003233 [Portunus trituberculatus]|uniref:Uncharacterized protein n=1 Tax=Portunus trituberculatus TaxID=210409 RepID=A0A5B7CQI2_PORTR|nr:hypothetical protein [Portunus trituberculatus]
MNHITLTSWSLSSSVPRSERIVSSFYCLSVTCFVAGTRATAFREGRLRVTPTPHGAVVAYGGSGGAVGREVYRYWYC